MSNFDSSYDLASYYEDLQNTVPHPKNVSKPRRFEYTNAIEFGQALHKWEINTEKYRQQISEYNQKVNEIRDQFELALKIYLNLDHNSNWKKLWNYAWENGRAIGYCEIAKIAEELADLIR